MTTRFVRMLTALAALWFSSPLSYGATIGSAVRDTAESAVLKAISTHLDGMSIDVRLGSVTSSSETQRRARVQVASLDSLPPPKAEISIDAEGFSQLFAESVALHESGIDTVLLAVGDVKNTDPRPFEEFEAEWQRAPKDKRVFVSFTRTDREYADKVAESLRQRGYLTFMYIHESGDRPWTNSVEVGRYFEQSGARLVIDTDNARQSLGVQVERATLLGLLDGSLRAKLRADEHKLELRAADGPGPCCRWCRRGGKAETCAELLGGGGEGMNCGPVKCGPFCGNATPAL